MSRNLLFATRGSAACGKEKSEEQIPPKIAYLEVIVPPYFQKDSRSRNGKFEMENSKRKIGNGKYEME
jgi:hypothetical protein